MYLVLSQAQFIDSISRGLYFRKGNKARIKIYIIKVYCSVHVTAVTHTLTNMAMGAKKEEGKNISNTEESRKNL